VEARTRSWLLAILTKHKGQEERGGYSLQIERRRGWMGRDEKKRAGVLRGLAGPAVSNRWEFARWKERSRGRRELHVFPNRMPSSD